MGTGSGGGTAARSSGSVGCRRRVRSIAVTGEAGRGTSLLLAETAHEAAAQGVTVTEGRATGLDRLSPLVTLVPRSATALCRCSTSPAGPSSRRGRPSVRQTALLSKRIAAYTRSRPLLNVLDDVQWADEGHSPDGPLPGALAPSRPGAVAARGAVLAAGIGDAQNGRGSGGVQGWGTRSGSAVRQGHGGAISTHAGGPVRAAGCGLWRRAREETRSSCESCCGRCRALAVLQLSGAWTRRWNGDGTPRRAGGPEVRRPDSGGPPVGRPRPGQSGCTPGQSGAVVVVAHSHSGRRRSPGKRRAEPRSRRHGRDLYSPAGRGRRGGGCGRRLMSRPQADGRCDG
ncbi:ATP-binding protein [Streptomyces sp. NPDC057027]|uniref:ATP-binding protein n=1 Tax=Streptomyces sp. NPDC057027 TaxID=3346004 RepID=UPI0036421CA0